mmetsp:Transcript_6048/g.7830  ORF Transcript_6048/g.7830 Transcript_6048/m.7830 type:complete len:117 (-) Transcript_6048:297-647(-)
MRVASRELKQRVERIMYIYYFVLCALFIYFYICLGHHGIDYTIELYIKGGLLLILVAALFHIVSFYVDNSGLSVAAGMFAITGIPVLLMAGFVYVWISIFFKHEWRSAWINYLKED